MARRIGIGKLELLVGGTRQERESELEEFQSAVDFAGELAEAIRLEEGGALYRAARSKKTL